MKKNEFNTHTYEEHVKETMRWRRTTTGTRADNLVDSARINATDTLKSAERTERWQDMYRASLRCLLSDERDRHVRKFFYSRGFHF